MEPIGADGRLIDREALRRSDAAAIELLVRTTIDRVHSLLRGMLGHREDAEDITQEVYSRVFRGLAAYRGDAEPATWVYRIAINVGRDAISARQVHRRREGGEVDDMVRSAANPERDVLAREESAMLRESLAAVSDEQREIILLADVESMSMEEISSVLDINVGTAKSRLSRARAALREEVKKRIGTWP